jgi:hypothetical protein
MRVGRKRLFNEKWLNQREAAFVAFVVAFFVTCARMFGTKPGDF